MNACADLERLARLPDRLAFVRRVVLLEETDSTNDDLRARAGEGAREGTVVVADRQRSGRGRHGRAWFSPTGLGLYLSVLFRPGQPVAEVTRWTLAAAVAACEACRACGASRIEIEWPNDIVFGRRKVGGILAELKSRGDEASELVIGAGINVHHRPDDFPTELRSTAASLREAVGKRELDRGALAEAYLERLDPLARLLARGGWDEIAARWSRLAVGAEGARVLARAEGRSRPICGTTRGLDRSGGLRVALDDGSAIIVRHGDTLTRLEE